MKELLPTVARTDRFYYGKPGHTLMLGGWVNEVHYEMPKTNLYHQHISFTYDTVLPHRTADIDTM